MGGVIRVAPGAGNDLQEAVDRAHPGDEILLLAGEHRHRATIRHGGRAGQPLVVRGEEGAHLVGPALPSPPDLFRMGIDGLPRSESTRLNSSHCLVSRMPSSA